MPAELEGLRPCEITWYEAMCLEQAMLCRA